MSKKDPIATLKFTLNREQIIQACIAQINDKLEDVLREDLQNPVVYYKDNEVVFEAECSIIE